ncbi:MAG: hypothetical protein ACREC6_01445 [Hyphomicrobiaceae bacterium]
MTDMEERERLMKQDVLLIATAACSLLNGMHFSPYFDPTAILLRPFLAGTPFVTPMVFFYLTSIFVSLMTLLIAGIPAALYERLKGTQSSTPISLGIWLAGTVLLAIPSLLNAAGVR